MITRGQGSPHRPLGSVGQAVMRGEGRARGGAPVWSFPRPLSLVPCP